MIRYSFKKGFSLVEVLVSSAILVIAFAGMLALYVALFSFADISERHLLAANAVQTQMEKIRLARFSDISSFNGITFAVTGIPSGEAIGAIAVRDLTLRANPRETLKEVRISVAFKYKGGIVVGEDKNLNGSLDAGEDTSPHNDRLDSPVEAITLISN